MTVHSLPLPQFQALGAEVLAAVRANLGGGDGYAEALNAARAAVAARRQQRTHARVLKVLRPAPQNPSGEPHTQPFVRPRKP